MADKATTETRKAPRPAVKENLASEADVKRFFKLIEQQEREFEAFLADIRARKTAEKTKLDKVYTDAAAALQSRGINKRVLRELYEESRRDAQDVRDNLQAKLWAMRACGFIVPEQQDLFAAPTLATPAQPGTEPEPAPPQDALARIYEKGRQAHLSNAPVDANPYEEGTRAHDEFNKGRADAQEETVLAMQPPKGRKAKETTVN